MKRWIVIALIAVFVLCLAGCGEDKPAPKPTQATRPSTPSSSAVPSDGEATATTTTTGSEANTSTDPEDPTDPTANSTTKPTSDPTKPTDTACGHKNVKDATCEAPSTCSDCGAVLGAALGHDFVDKKCSRCGKKNPNYVPRVEVIGIKLDKTEAEMLVGDMLTLMHTLSPTTATDKDVTWKSSNPSVATVSDVGVVTAVSIGETTITVSSVNGKTATCKISVKDIVVDMPTLPVELFYNAQHNDVAIYMFLEGVDYTFTQTSANEGTLLFLFDGELTYAGDGHGGYTYPNFGWRLYNSSHAVVAEGIAQSDEALAIGAKIAGLTAEVPSLKLGKYRLELYSTYKRKQ